MLRTRPLTYLEPSGGTAYIPQNAVFVTGAATGAIGEWAATRTVGILDPSGNNTLVSVVGAFNSLTWALKQTRLLVAEPRIWFGVAGTEGVQIVKAGVNHRLYVPYAGGVPYFSPTVGEIINALNVGLGGVGEFMYDGSRVVLIVKTSSISLQEPAGAFYGPARRMLNRIFGRKDTETWIIGKNLAAQAYYGGDVVDGPIFGMFAAPAPATNLQVVDQGASGFRVQWDGGAPDVKYYVRATGGGHDIVKLVDDVSANLGLTDGLSAGISYTVTVVATSPYEITTVQPTIPGTFGQIIPTPNIIAVTGIDPYSVKATIDAPAPSTGIASVILTISKVGSADITEELTYSGVDYITSMLDPVTTYSIKARFKMSDAQEGADSNAVTVTTPALPANPLTAFGALTPIDSSQTSNESHFLKGVASYIGFRVDPGSSWIGYSFNSINFPLLSFQGMPVLTNVYSIAPNTTMKAQVFNDSSLTTLLNESNTIQISVPSSPYLFTMNSTTMLKPKMCIVMTLVSGADVSFRMFANSGLTKIPLVGIVSDDITGAIKDDTNSSNTINLGISCDFLLI